ncbi:MAG: hypothetical protein WBA22_04465 [Candidatus Methanofastidiosia archaeon]
MARIDVLMKQLEIAHKRDQQLGSLIMLVKGWALTLFLGMAIAYFELSGPLPDPVYQSQSSRFALIPIFLFGLLWIVEGLMGAYQKPYYEKRDEIQKSIQEELRGDSKCRNLIFVPYDMGANQNKEVLKDLIKCIFHFSVGLFYLAIISILLWLYDAKCSCWLAICAAYIVIAILMYLKILERLKKKILS